MRLPNAAHESRPWRIREIVPDFKLEDVWALPVQGGAEDFPALLELMASPIPPTRTPCRPASSGASAIVSANGSTSARSRPRSRRRGQVADSGHGETSLPAACRRTCAGPWRTSDFGSLPFVPLYRTDDEFAAEISNRTMHGVMHLAWADRAKVATRRRWPSTSSRAVASARLHGADQAVPPPDRLPGADAADRANLERRASRGREPTG